MIFQEFAIEPAYLSNWDRLRLIVDQCGFDHGRLISDFPRDKWRWRVFESCAQCLPADKKRIEEYLKNVSPKLIRRGRTFVDGSDWIKNAKREHTRFPFHAVVTADPHPGSPDFVEGSEVQSGHPKWQSASSDVVFRTTDALTEPARELLAQSREILFIDPHFEPKGAYSKPLCRFVELASAGRQLTRLEYHLEHDSTAEHFVDKFTQVVLSHLRLPPSVNLRLIRWKSFNELPRDAMHPRYILTDLAGLRYDYGLCEGNDGETTDIQIIAKAGAIYQQRWAHFAPTSTAFEFADGYEVSPQGVSRLRIRDGRFQVAG